MRKLSIALTLLALATNLQAQAPGGAWEINPQRVRMGGNLKMPEKTIVVPSLQLLVSVSGSANASQKGGYGASAKGKFFVDGLDKPWLQDLSKKLQDDLVNKLKGAGYTVLTYDDIKDEPAVSERGRNKDNEKWGLPTRKLGTTTYVNATATDAQAFDAPIQGLAWAFNKVADEHKAMVLTPEIWFSAPQMWGVSEQGYKRTSAKIEMSPVMKMTAANVIVGKPKKGQASMYIAEHGERLAAENAGTIETLKEDKIEISSEWKRATGDYVMRADHDAMAAGILKVGYAFNDYLVNEVKKANNK